MKQVRDPNAFRAAMSGREGLSMRELATLAKTSHPTISALLSGGRCDPAIARRLASVLRLPIDDLFQVAASTGEPSNDQAGAVA